MEELAKFFVICVILVFWFLLILGINYVTMTKGWGLDLTGPLWWVGGFAVQLCVQIVLEFIKTSVREA